MKKPEEYFKFMASEDGIIELYNESKTDFIKAIKQAQTDSYNQALLDVINNIKIKTAYKPIDDYSGSEKTVVDEQSILKLRRN